MKFVSRYCVLPLVLFSIVVDAADKNEGPVYTSLSEVDSDYKYQGEYRGWQRSNASSRSSESVAIQVIALGNSEFAASKYYGGLPGEGWFGGQRYELKGEAQGDVVMLRGDNYDIKVDGETAVIFAKDGRQAGVLKKWQRVSPTMGAKPPAGAIVLFDGSGTDRFKGAKMTDDGLLLAGTETKSGYQDFRLHGEFRLPYKPMARGQGRGNSGFYLQSRYEVQVLDSFGLEGIENECGALYRTRRPDFNMCLPPLQWQTYDIDLTSPKFDEQGKKIANMRISVWHNGVLIHNDVEIRNKTGAGKPEGPQPLPTKIQDHGNPVVYRNIWLIEKDRETPADRSWVDVPVKAPPVPTSQFQLPGWQ